VTTYSRGKQEILVKAAIQTEKYETIDADAGNIGDCTLCGNKPRRNEGHRLKSAWLKERFAEGLRYKVLRSRQSGDIGMIEYAPGNNAWRPIEAEGYLVIHCLTVNARHKGKGLGRLLLDSCLADARKSNCSGVAVVTSSDSFMARSDLFIKAGFVVVDSIAPYELLARKLKKAAPYPHFIVNRRMLRKYNKGLTILAADQCPYAARSAPRIAEAARTLGLEPRLVRLTSARTSRDLPTPYGIFSVIYDGKLIAGRPISAARFLNIMRKTI
jgi:GNAT superfamily N-acetyltransferase